MTKEKITRICSVENCTKPVRATGLCGAHYERKRTYGSEYALGVHRQGCLIDGCARPHKSKGYCRKHYTYLLLHGTPHYQLQRVLAVGTTLEERFWSQVDKTEGLGRDGDCWEWQGAKRALGYGVMQFQKQRYHTHRLSWELANNRPVTDGLFILHSCDNPSCVNPAHLREGTQYDNMQDAKVRNRQAVGKQKQPNALDEHQVITIRSLLKEGHSRQDIMKSENVSYRSVRSVATERAYHWVGQER